LKVWVKAHRRGHGRLQSDGPFPRPGAIWTDLLLACMASWTIKRPKSSGCLPLWCTGWKLTA